MSAVSQLKAAHVLVAILSVIVQMSDDVKNAASPLDAQGKLLRLHNSIQKNAARMIPYINALTTEREQGDGGA